MENVKLIGIAAIVGLLIGAGVTYKLLPPKETIKVQTVEHEVVKKDVKTIIKEVVKKDGTKEIDTIITDNSSSNKTEETEMSKQTSINPNWIVSAGVGRRSLTDLNNVYSLSVQRRIAGPIFAGVGFSGTGIGDNSKEISALISLEF